jgi:hypothetical protein
MPREFSRMPCNLRPRNAPRSRRSYWPALTTPKSRSKPPGRRKSHGARPMHVRIPTTRKTGARLYKTWSGKSWLGDAGSPSSRREARFERGRCGYRERNEEVARRFKVEVSRTIELLEQFPLTGGFVPGVEDPLDPPIASSQLPIPRCFHPAARSHFRSCHRS